MGKILFALLYVLIITQLHAKKDRKAIKSFKKGYDKFLNRQGDKKDSSKAAKKARFKVFERNRNAMKSIDITGRKFKFNDQSNFLFLSDDERKQYLGLQNTTMLEKESETDVPRRGGRPKVNRGRSKVNQRARKQRPGRAKGKGRNKKRGRNNKDKNGKSGNGGGNGGGKRGGKGRLVLEKRQEEDALPSSLDLRNFNLVSPPRDQQLCSSCWAFGGVAVLEGAFALSTGSNCFFDTATHQNLTEVPTFSLARP